MKIGDSRSWDGPGVLPLQDHMFEGRKAPLDQRFSVLGLRVTGRRDGSGELGQAEYGEDTVGDLSGFLIWPFSEDEHDARPIAAWREVFPAIRPLTRDAGGGPTTGGGPAGEIPPDSRTPFDGPPAITPSGDATIGLPGGSGGGGSFDLVPEPATGATSDAVSDDVLPIRGEEWTEDRRFARIQPTQPGGASSVEESPWPKYPGGHIGIVVASTDEGTQIEQFHPTDPRLVAPHRGGSEALGTWVVDVSPDGDHTSSHKAHLQSLTRVVRRPKGELSFAGNSLNSLSWNIGRTGLGNIVGGLMTDKGGRSTRHAATSCRDGGYTDVGGHADKHNIGQDADGNPINPAHLSGRAFWREHAEDGPMYFEKGPYLGEYELPFKTHCHLKWRAPITYQWPRDAPQFTDRGVWSWYSSCAFAETTPGGETGDTPGQEPDDPGGPTTPPGEPGGGPITPGPGVPTIGGGTGTPGTGTPGGPTIGGGGGGGGPSTDKSIEHTYTITSGSGADQRARPMIFTYRDLALNALSGRPQLVRGGATDLAHSRRVDDAEVRDYDERAPVTWRAFTYGAQGGTAGDSVFAPTGSESPADRHEYTQEPRSSRSPSGTGNGGLVFTVPEAFPDDIDADLRPASGSTSYVIAAPGVRFGVGVPDLPTGGLRDGYSWEEDGSGGLVFYRHDSSGTRTLVLTLDASGNMTPAGTVDGRDVAADGSKLDGIESGADVTDATNVDAAGAVMESDFDAHTILAANADNTPAALTISEQRLVGRITGGNITGLTATQIRTLINVEDGAEANTTEFADNVFRVQDNVDPTKELAFDVTGVTTGTTRTLTVPDANGTIIISGSDASLNSVTVSGGDLTIADASDIVLGTTTGTKIGTSTSQLLGFFNATPVTQRAAISDASGGSTIDGEARTAINAVLAALRDLGLIAT